MKKALQSIDKKLVVIIGLCCLLLVLISALGGYYLKHTGDDFTLSYYASTGPLNYLVTYLTKINGRFSYALVSLVVYQIPGLFIKLTPVVFYSLFIGGFYTLLKRLTGFVDRLVLLVLSLVLTFCLASVPVNVYQTIYWLPAYLAYGLPLSLLLFLFAYLLKLRDRNTTSVNLWALFAASLFIGGLNELVAVLGPIFLVLAFCLVELNNILITGRWARAQIKNKAVPYLVSIGGFIAAFVLSYLAPATSTRMLDSQSASTFESKREMLRLSWEFSVNLFRSTLHEPVVIWCILATLFISAVLYRHVAREKSRLNQIHPTTAYVSLSVFALLPFVVLFITSFISNYSQESQPVSREYAPFYFTLVLCIALASLMLAALCSTWSKRAVISTLGFLGLALLILSPFVFYSYGHKTLSLNSQDKAQMKSEDAREADIKAMVAGGQKNILIPSYMTVGDTPYPKSDPKYWLNEDMAHYYGASSLIAK